MPSDLVQDLQVIDASAVGRAGSGGTIDPARVEHPVSELQGGASGVDDVPPAVGTDATPLYRL